MSLLDAFKQKDNPYGIPLLSAGLSILAANRGDTAGAPALLAGLKAGLGSYKEQKEQRLKDQLNERIAKAFGSYVAPAASGAVQALTDSRIRQAGATPNGMAQSAEPVSSQQPPATSGMQNATGGVNGIRGLINELAIAGMNADTIHQILPVLAKNLPDYQAQNLMVRGADGQAQPMMINSHGNTTMLPYNIAGKQHAVDLGGQSFMVDEYTGKPTAAFDKSVSPDAQLKANTAYGVAGMNNRNAMDIANLNNQTRLAVGEMRTNGASGDTSKPTEKQAENNAIFSAMQNEVNHIEKILNEGFSGMGPVDDALISMPSIVGRHTRGFASPHAQQMNSAVNALRGFVTKAIHGGRASNQDMEQVTRMLSMSENDDPKVKQFAIERLRNYLKGMEMRANGVLSTPQQPALEEIEEELDWLDGVTVK